MLRKRGKFYHVIYCKDGKQHWVSTKKEDELEAREFELEFLKAFQQRKETGRLAEFIEKVTTVKVETKCFPLAEAWPYYQREFCAKSSKNIVNKKRCQLHNFLTWLAKNYPEVNNLHEVTYLMVKGYSQYMLDRGIKEHTHNIYCAYLKEIFKRLAFPAELLRNPWDYLKAPAAAHVSYRILEPSEIRKLMKKATPDWQMAILISRYTGLDFANVRRLRWSDIEQIRVNKETISVINTQRKKTGTRLQIPVHPLLQEQLDQYRQESSVHREYVLPSTFQSRGCEGQFPELLKACKISDNVNGIVGFHSLRHTFNSLLESVGVDVGTRQRLTGHSSASMNLLYSHAIEPLAEVIKRLK